MLSQRAGGLICFLWQVAPLPGAPPLYSATDGLTPRVAREITEGTPSPPYLPRPSGAANEFDQACHRIRSPWTTDAVGGSTAKSRASSPGEQAAACDCQKSLF